MSDLAPRDVHIWIVPLDAPNALQPAWRTLAPDERTRAVRLATDRHRHRFVIARGVLRALLGGYLGVKPSQIALTYAEGGKPSVVVPFGRAPVQFNVAHCDGLAAYAVGLEKPAGIDLERVRRVAGADRIAARLFTRDERVHLSGLRGEARRRAFLRCWTRKEAYLKATGHGLAHARVADDGIETTPGEWRLANFEIGTAYIGAIASRDAERACRSGIRHGSAAQLIASASGWPATSVIPED